MTSGYEQLTIHWCFNHQYSSEECTCVWQVLGPIPGKHLKLINLQEANRCEQRPGWLTSIFWANLGYPEKQKHRIACKPIRIQYWYIYEKFFQSSLRQERAHDRFFSWMELWMAATEQGCTLNTQFLHKQGGKSCAHCFNQQMEIKALLSNRERCPLVTYLWLMADNYAILYSRRSKPRH